MALYPVIMCGGSGTRLWPASRTSRPKQFIPLTGDRSTFQETVERISGIPGAAEILIVAGVGHAAAIADQLAEIGARAQVILEPEPRDSAPAMAAACAWIAARDPAGVAAVVSADHHVPDSEAFRTALSTAAEAAKAGSVVTLGVAPLFASTAYGYIAPGESLGEVRRVDAFVEKPAAETAKAYIDQGYLWNSGNFVVAAATLLSELDRFAPGVAEAARQAVAGATGDEVLVLGEAFRSAPKISIDYALMEKTDRAAVLPVAFSWTDLGAWDAVWNASAKDAEGNAARGEALFVDAENCLVRAPEGLQVTVIGAKNLAVIADAGQVLVCDLDQSQSVKTAVDRLKAAGRESLPEPAPFTDLAGAGAWFHTWLHTSALPLWWSLGADHDQGGFHEALTPGGEPVYSARRARVQTRQAFVYAAAGGLGWKGPYRQAAWHGLDYFLNNYKRPDGQYRTLVAPDGASLDETAVLYDQAFALLAMATVHQMEPGRRDLLSEARSLLSALQARRHPAGGFLEIAPFTYQANAHMHLLEASLAWAEAGGGPEWEALAAEIVDLALTRFIDPEGGFLREFFDASWAPMSGKDGRILEPGHQFEWAWLMARWAKRGHPEAQIAARRLFEAGVRGFDEGRGVAINALLDDLSVHDAAARLWPQTEYLKASVILRDEVGEAHILRAAQGLHHYLRTPALGAWRDKYQPDGTFIQEPAPASSFYHIVAACMELRPWMPA